jgi:hypothetical protein
MKLSETLKTTYQDFVERINLLTDTVRELTGTMKSLEVALAEQNVRLSAIESHTKLTSDAVQYLHRSEHHKNVAAGKRIN